MRVPKLELGNQLNTEMAPFLAMMRHTLFSYL